MKQFLGCAHTSYVSVGQSCWSEPTGDAGDYPNELNNTSPSSLLFLKCLTAQSHNLPGSSSGHFSHVKSQIERNCTPNFYFPMF